MLTAVYAWLFKDFIPDNLAGKIGADSVATILHILASSMLAVTTFSLSTMVTAYVAASSSATPRATKLLLEDNTAQNALSVFIGSFLFSVVGIIGIETGIYGGGGRLILFAVTLCVIFAIIATLLKWIDHLSRLGRVGETIDLVEKAASKAIAQRLKRPCLGGTPLEEYKNDAMHVGITHKQIGYIQNIDMQQLSELAEKHAVHIYVTALPGAFNDSAQAMAYISGPLKESEYDCIRNAFSIAGDRTFDQDPRYGLIVLSEIAARALSPGINDFGTAIDVIGTAVRTMAPWVSHDAGAPEVEFPRVHVPTILLSDLFDDMFGAIARDGAGMLEVVIRLQKAYASLALIGNEACKKEVKRYSALTLKWAQNAPAATSNSPICGRVKIPQGERQEWTDCYAEGLAFARRLAASLRR